MFTFSIKKPQKTIYYQIEWLNGGAKFRKSYIPTISIDKIIYIEDIEKLTTHQFLQYLGLYRAYLKGEKNLDAIWAYEVRRLHDYLMTPHGEKRIQDCWSDLSQYSFSSLLSDYYRREFLSTMDNVFRWAPEVSRNYAEIMRGYYAEFKDGDILAHPKEEDTLRVKYPDMVLNTKIDGILGPNVVTVLSHS